MTPDQINTVTNGLLAAYDWVNTHGPELAAGITAPIAWHVGKRINRRHDRRRGLRRLEQYANHPGSRAILDDFHQPRKEN